MKTIRIFQVMDLNLQVPVADTSLGLFTDIFSNWMLYLQPILPKLSQFFYIFEMWDFMIE